MEFASGKEKKVFELMKLKGTAVAATKENIPEINRVLNIVLKPLENYINGPDQSSRSRHEFTPLHYVILTNGYLFDVWVQIGYNTNRPKSVLHVVELVDGVITHIVKAEDYAKLMIAQKKARQLASLKRKKEKAIEPLTISVLPNTII